MNKETLVLLILILTIFFAGTNTLECGENQIENCKECSKEVGDSCGICEPNHFPLLENLFCLPCNDPRYGQVGCKGECVRTNNTDSPFIYCTECEKGFFNEDGICRNCSEILSGCSECAYEKVGSSDEEKLKCKKCLNEEEYSLNELSGKCIHCSDNQWDCKKCHYKKDKSLQSECEECSTGCLNSNKECENHIINIDTSGSCYRCKNNEKPEYCECNSEYILFSNNSCIKFPSDPRCNVGETKNAQNRCVSCGGQCQFCNLDVNNKQKCLFCGSNKIITEDNQCLSCPSSCSNCEYDKAKGKTVCIKCGSDYVLDPDSLECIPKCLSNEDIGQGCISCEFDPLSKKYECTECSYSYSFINNTNSSSKCLLNNNKNNNELYGCKFVELNQKT